MYHVVCKICAISVWPKPVDVQFKIFTYEKLEVVNIYQNLYTCQHRQFYLDRRLTSNHRKEVHIST